MILSNSMAQRGGYRPGAGRKKGAASIIAEGIRALIAKKFQEEIEPIVDKAIKQAKRGDRYARDWLTENSIGRAPQALIHTGDEDGGPIKVDITAPLKKVYGAKQIGRAHV